MPRVWPAALTPPSGELFVLIAPAVQRCLEDFLATDPRTREAGGLLLGLRRDPHLELIEATLPTSRDFRSRFRFVRRCPSHQIAATHAWQASGHVMDYVGEWHTHPELRPVPSAVDRSELIRRSAEYRHEPLVELILGMEGIWAAMVQGDRYIPLMQADTNIAKPRRS